MSSYLVTGGSGQLGQCFHAVVKEFIELNLFFATRNEVDISIPETIENFYCENPFDGIINCAAYTNVDKAERDEESSYKINTEGLQNLIKFAKKKNISIIHFSTDYVFDGLSAEPYQEEAVTKPMGIYGNSKLKGEIFLLKSSFKKVIVRTSWLFSPFGKNFVTTVTRIAKEKSELKVIDDQWGRPSYGIDLARRILGLISNNKIYTYPILHFANKGICNWKEFAEAISNELRYKTKIKGVPTSDYPNIAKRPKYSILDTRRIEKKLGVSIPTWQESLKKCIKILRSNGNL